MIGQRRYAKPGPGPEPAGESADDAGFTLAEVLVAFAIASLGTLLAIEIAGAAAAGARRLEIARVVLDEAEGVALRRLAAGPIEAGLSQGAFSNGAIWTLGVTDLRPVLGMKGGPPLWRLRVTRDGPAGETLYSTIMPGDPDG